MPEFVSQCDLSGLDDIVRGFLQCAEFTMDDDIKDKPIIGWNRDAIRIAKSTVKAFLKAANPDDLHIYRQHCSEAHGYSADECIGHDIWYDMNGRGVGFLGRAPKHPNPLPVNEWTDKYRAEKKAIEEPFERLALVALLMSERYVWRGKTGYLSLGQTF